MKSTWFQGQWLDRLGLLFLAAAMVSIAVYSSLQPRFNWDMIPYVALVEGGTNPTVAHDRAYRLVHATVPAQDWIKLTQRSPYRRAQYANVSAFDTQLGMYRIKVGYIQAARALRAFVPTVRAYRLINLFALAMLSAVMIWWMLVGGFGRAAFFLVPIFVLAGLPATARLLTPDLLCASLAVAGLALLRRGPWPLAAACFAAATLVRPDFIFLPAALLAVALLMRTSTKEALSCFAAAAVAYGLTMLAGDHPGWWPHFSLALVERSSDLRSAPPFSFEAYMSGFKRGMLSNVKTQMWPSIVALLAGCWLLLPVRRGHQPRQADWLFLALVLSLAARCVVFPLPEDRVYLATVIMLALLISERWGTQFPDAESDGATSEQPQPLESR